MEIQQLDIQRTIVNLDAAQRPGITLDNLTLREKGVEYELDVLDPPSVVGWHPMRVKLTLKLGKSAG